MDKRRRRVLIKLSGEALAGDGGHGFCDATIEKIAVDLVKAKQHGTKMALVVGGGNFWRGRSGKHIDRVRADQIGMLATVMNALYLAESFRKLGLRSEVMTPMPFANMTTVYEKRNAQKLMDRGKLVIHAAGLCHPFFSTDTVTALRAAEIDATCVLYTKNGVSGVYDKIPTDPTARIYKTLSYGVAIKNDLQFADSTALSILTEAKLPSFVFGLNENAGISRICENLSQHPGFGTLLKTETEEIFY
ncbi:MAG: UMP kinase [Turicibacter sp.]|nr:UMP kinase [Turicibacter sp.]